MSLMTGEDKFILEFVVLIASSGIREYLVLVAPVCHSRNHNMRYIVNQYLHLAEQTKMNDCYFETKDWRKCKREVRTTEIRVPTADYHFACVRAVNGNFLL